MKTTATLALLLLASTATAANPPPEARAHFDAGDKAYKLGDFARAIKEYQASFELFPSPLLLYDIAQAFRMLGENEKALFSYKQYLVDAPPGDFRAFAEEQVGKLEPLIEAERRTRKSPPTTTAKPDAVAADPERPPRADATVHEAPHAAPLPPATHPRWWVLATVGGVLLLGAIAAILAAELAPSHATPPPSTLGNAVFSF